MDDSLLLCGICQESAPDDWNELGELDACTHRFCYPCISKWAEIESKCPFCKVRFTSIARKLLGSPSKLKAAGSNPAARLPGTYVGNELVPERNQRVVFEDPTLQEWMETLSCMVCGASDHDESLLLCDGCDVACHTYCCGLAGVPEGEWFCTTCVRQRQRDVRRLVPNATVPSRRRRAAATRTNNTTTRRLPRSQVQIEDSEEEIIIESDGIEDDEEEEEVYEEQQPDADGWRRVRRPTSQQPPRRRATGTTTRNRSQPAMDTFIVSDDDDEEDPAAEYAPSNEGRRRRRTSSRPSGSRARRTVVIDSGSDEEAVSVYSETDDEDEWQSDGHVSPESDRKVRRIARRSRQRAGTRRQQQQPASVDVPLRQRIGSRAGTSSVAPTADHRRVDAIQSNWQAIRNGTTDFSAILAPVQTQPLLPRRRLVRAADATTTSNAQQQQQQRRQLPEVINLISPSPRAAGPSSSMQRPRVVDDDSDEELTEAARARAMILEARDKGSKLAPKSVAAKTPLSALQTRMHSGGTNNINTSGGGGSHRLRTVGDIQFGIEVARRSSLGQQRLQQQRDGQIRTATTSLSPAWKSVKRPRAEGRDSGVHVTIHQPAINNRSSSPPPRYRQQQEQQPDQRHGSSSGGWKQAKRDPPPATINSQDSPMPLLQRLQMQMGTSENFWPNRNKSSTPSRLAQRTMIEETPPSNNPKVIVMDMAKTQLKPMYESGIITKDQYKQVAKDVVSQLQHQVVAGVVTERQVAVEIDKCLSSSRLS